MKVRFTPEALLALREKRAWWQQHRDKAPELFVQELATIVSWPIFGRWPGHSKAVPR